MQNTATLREKVKKYNNGKPSDGDLIVCNNLLGEIRNRANKIMDYSKQVDKYTSDIAEYLVNLEKRGLKFPDVPIPAKK